MIFCDSCRRCEARPKLTQHHRGEPQRSLPLARKVGWAVLTGFIAFSGSVLLDNVLHVTLGDQLILTSMAGSVTLMVQYLAEFEQKLVAFEGSERQAIADVQHTINNGFVGVSEATELLNSIEKSPLNQDALKHVIHHAGRFTGLSIPLVRCLADSEVERLAETLQWLSGGRELPYEGEDREYLLGLTRKAKRSIMATSWTTVNGLDAGFWSTDLGVRYLDLQRTALQRDVKIKRVFIFETPNLMQSELVRQAISAQRAMGFEIRLLPNGPKDGSIADFVLFDEEVCHDTFPVPRLEGSQALNTRLTFDQGMVHTRLLQFRDLWSSAEVS